MDARLIISADREQYAISTGNDLAHCMGNSPKLCPFALPMANKAKASCLSALFFQSKNDILAECDFKFIPEGLQPGLKILSPGRILVSAVSNLTIHCPEKSFAKKSCTFCVMVIPCGCGISGSEIYIAPQIVGCTNSTKSTSEFHPVNLAVLQHFFDPKALAAISGESLFDAPIDISLPEFKIFKHNFSELIAEDKNQHLSLQRAAAAAKADDYIFQNLAGPILDGRLPELDTIWSAIVKYLSLVTASVTAVLVIIVIWQLYKIRALTIALAVCQKSLGTEAFRYTHPPLHYTDKHSPTDNPAIISDSVDYFNFTYLSLVFVLILIVYCLVKKLQSHKTTLLLQVTDGSSCVRIPIKAISICSGKLHFTALHSIKTILVKRKLFFPEIIIDWGDLEVSHAGLAIPIPSRVKISPWQAFCLNKVLKTRFLAHFNTHGT